MNHRLPRFTRSSILTLMLAMAAAATGFISSPASAQRGGGGYEIEFRNESSRGVKLMHWDPARSQWDSHGSVNPRSAVYQTSNAGDHWAFVDPRTNKVLNSVTVGRFARQLAISDKHFGAQPGGQAGGGGGGHDDHDDHDHGQGQQQAVMVEVHAINHSSQVLYLYRDGGRGSFEYVTTLTPGQESEVTTPIQTTWAMVVPKGSRVVSKLTANAPHNELEVHDRDLGPPPPTVPAKPTVQTVTVTFVNLANESLIIHHAEPGGRGGHAASTLQPRHQQQMNVNAGDQYQVLRSADRVLVDTFPIPNRNTTFTINQQQVRGRHPGGGGGGGHDDHDHDDHAHGGGKGGGGHDDHDDHAHGGDGHDDHDDDHDDHDDHDEHGPGAGGGGKSRTIVVDPRELLRNIFGR